MKIETVKITQEEAILLSYFMEENIFQQITFNDIMPVVEKIESIHNSHHGYFGVYINSNSCSIQGTKLHLSLRDSNYGDVYMSDPNAILNTKLQSTVYNVIEFIKWYNSIVPMEVL